MFRKLTIALLMAQAAVWLQATSLADVPNKATSSTPNIVVIFIDDMGYGDIGPFGAKGYKTPALDQMAREGRCFTDFLVSSAVCSASRAALLTGCYHERVGIRGALGPNNRNGIADSETTIAEVCKSKGYATACFGKWHLGQHRPFLPLQHGFDEYYGLPYSNDMWPLHPDYAKFPPGTAERKQGYPDLPMHEGNEICDESVDGNDQARMTGDYTRRAVDFIERNRDRPFFLYVPHSMVHVPLFVSDKFKGSSGAGLFGDVVQEVDWSVGQILDKLRELNIAENTLVIFTSDNGPWLSYGNHAGNSGGLREGKGTMFEGGVREPTIMWWPGKIPAATHCNELASTIDLLPTVAGLIGAELPPLPIDGVDISKLLLSREDTPSPRDSFYYYYSGGELQAVRDRQWKLVMAHSFRSMNGKPGGVDGSPADYTQLKTTQKLFDLKADPAESNDVSEANPDVVERLLAMAETARADLGDSLTNRNGPGIRPCGKLPPSKDGE